MTAIIPDFLLRFGAATAGSLLVAVTVIAAEPPCGPDDVACWEARVAADPADMSARLALGEALADRAMFGDHEAVDAALQQYEAIVSRDPSHALARARRGFLWVLQAGDLATPRAQLDRARRGFAEMDAAVALAPTDPAVRLVRARNAYQMPAWLERGGIAGSDFAWLRAQIEARSEAVEALRREILFHAGAHALRQRRAEAVVLLEKALGANGREPADATVQSMLALAREAFTPHVDAEKEER